MNHSVPISVVMPVFNAGKYLTEAIESILVQTFPDFELIIIDDGSTDDSADIIRSFAGQDKRIKPIFTAHAGIVSALKTGLETASGKYVARMDADDVSLPERFQLQHDFMEKGHADLCGGHYVVIDETGNYLYTHVVSTRPNLAAVILSRTVPFAHGSAMIRRSFIEENDITYRVVPNAEDYAFWIDCFENGACITNLNKFVYLHRIRQNNEPFGGRAIHNDARTLSKAFVKRRHNLILDQIRTCVETDTRFNLYEQNCVAHFLIRTLFGGYLIEKIRILRSLGKQLVLLTLLHHLRLL